MSTIKQIRSKIEDGQSLKMVAEAYSEIAALKLNRIRGQIEKNISFGEELASLFILIKNEARKRKITTLIKKKGTIHILLTSNYRFYGGLDRSLLTYFLTGSQKIASENPSIPNINIVVGKVGGSDIKDFINNFPFQSVIFQKDFPNDDELRQLVTLINQYQNILVYHARFKTVLSQIPVVSDITRSNFEAKADMGELQYIFEPEIEQMLRFFDTQINQILIEQTFLESDLARTAARLISMDDVQTRSIDYINNQNKMAANLDRRIKGIELLETITSSNIWRK